MSETGGSGLFRSASLTGRLVRTYLLLSALTVLLVAAAAYEGGKTALRTQALSRLETVAAQKERYLNLWVEDRKRDLVLLAADLTLNSRLPISIPDLNQDPAVLPEYTRLSIFFAAAVEARPDLSEIMLLSPTGGRVLASSRPAGVGRFRTTYNFYLKGREGLSLQSAYPSPESLRPVMTVSMPLRGQGGELLGVLAEHLNLERLDAMVRDRAGLGETGETYLVDSFHTFVSAEIIGRNGGRGLHTPAIDLALSGTNGKGAYANYAGVPVIGVYRWLPEYRMALLAEMSQAEAFDPARRLAGQIIAVGALAALALALGVRLLSRRLARPVLEVTRAAQAVADGDLSARAPVLTHDELGSLARAFNKMAEDIQDLYAQLNRQIMERTAILQHARDGIAVVDRRGDVHYVSPGMERLFGMKAHDITSIREWLDQAIPGEAERRTLLAAWLQDAETPEPPERIIHFRGAGEESRWARFHMAHMPDGRLVMTAQDITEMKASEARARHMALHDPLTGLPNRQLFVDRLAQALKHSRRTGLHMALLYLDLDRFKAMNDTHGHQFGDAVLREAATRLASCVRESDTVARIGGDEFVVVLSDLAEPANAAAVAAKIREALLAPDLPGGLYLAGVSIGIAVSPRDGRDQDSLLSAADRAMYVVKRRGGNGYTFASAPEDA
ncbi:diguanylate cyclase [Desulfovibrio aminophilus]|nr:diguanylate cyclase [Desulfovibrio aminophilus]MCM0755559.1 diguanylate cyclase [Desulfovibrio aminophilus]